MGARLNANRERRYIADLQGHNDAELQRAKDLLEECTANREADKLAARSLFCAWAQAKNILELLDLRGFDTPVSDAIVQAVTANAAWRHQASVRLRLPGFSENGIDHEIADAVRKYLPSTPMDRIREAVRGRVHLNARKIGVAFGVTLALRQDRKLWMIAPCDLSDDEFRAWQKGRKRDNDRKRAAEDRATDGATPHYRSDSAIGRRIGVDRKTIKRWREKGILEEKLAQYQNAPISSPKGSSSFFIYGDEIGPSDQNGAKSRHGRGASKPPRPETDLVFSEEDIAAIVRNIEADAATDLDEVTFSHPELVSESFGRAAAILRPQERKLAGRAG